MQRNSEIKIHNTETVKLVNFPAPYKGITLHGATDEVKFAKLEQSKLGEVDSIQISKGYERGDYVELTGGFHAGDVLRFDCCCCYSDPNNSSGIRLYLFALVDNEQVIIAQSDYLPNTDSSYANHPSKPLRVEVVLESDYDSLYIAKTDNYYYYVTAITSLEAIHKSSLDVIITKEAEHEQEMMKSDFIMLSWKDVMSKELAVDAYIEHNGLRFLLLEPYAPEQRSEIEFSYEPKFQHPKMYLGKVTFKRPSVDTASNPITYIDWPYTGAAKTVLTYLIDTINETFGLKYDSEDASAVAKAAAIRASFGITDTTLFTVELIEFSDEKIITTQFSKVDILGAITNVANACECEWHLDWEERKLYFGRILIEGQTTKVLTVGGNVKIPSRKNSKDGYWNAFEPQGSKRNIMRKSSSQEFVQSDVRLSLNREDYPDGILYTDGLGNEITKERFDELELKPYIKPIIFEEVYPRTDLYVYDVLYRESYMLDDDGNKVVAYTDENGEVVYLKQAKWFFRLALPFKRSNNVTEWVDYDLSESVEIELTNTTVAGGYIVNYIRTDMMVSVGTELFISSDHNGYGYAMIIEVGGNYYPCRGILVDNGLHVQLYINIGPVGNTYSITADELTQFKADLKRDNTARIINGIDKTKVPSEFKTPIILDGTRPIAAFQPNTETGAVTTPLAGLGGGDGNGHYGFYLRSMKMNGAEYLEEVNEEPTEDDDTGVVDMEGNRRTVTEDFYELEFEQNETTLIPSIASQGIIPKEYVDSQTHQPSYKNNKVNVYNIAIGKQFERSAQAELAAKTLEYIEESLRDNNAYTFKSNPVDFYNNSTALMIGEQVLLDDGKDIDNPNRIDEEHQKVCRVQKLVTKIDHPFEQEIVVGNEILKSSQTQVKDTVESLINGNVAASSINGNGGGGISLDQVKAWVTTRFLSKVVNDSSSAFTGFAKGIWIKTRNLFGFDEDGNIKANNVDASGSGVFGWLQGLYGIFGSIISSNYSGDGIADTGWRLTNDSNGHSKLTVDELYVRMRAIFEELEVKKEKVSGGNEVKSSASSKITRVDYIDASGEVIGYTQTRSPFRIGNAMSMLLTKVAGTFSSTGSERVNVDIADVSKIRCYFLAKDGDNEIKNEWRVGDLARCQTFNLKTKSRDTKIDNYTPAGADTIIEGRTKAGNVFWWRRVVGVSTDPVTVDGKDMHYFDVSVNDCWIGSDIPMAGDDVSQWGNVSDPERMNLYVLEVNGADAPATKYYEGIYTYNMGLCWFGGNPCKAMLSPKSGYKFNGSKFVIETSYGTAPVVMERGEWDDITPTPDNHHITSLARKCYYYDSVSHNGSLWLCVKTRSYFWIASEAFSQEIEVVVEGQTVSIVVSYEAGEEVPDDRYSALTPANKAKCARIEDYTTEEPSEHSNDWEKRVSKGENGVTPVKNVDYFDGNDAILVRLVAENAIIKQSTTKINNSYPLLPVGYKEINHQSTPVLAMTEVHVLLGESELTVGTDFTVGTPVPSKFDNDGTQSPVCNAVVCDDGKTVAITAVNVKDGKYIDNGYVTIPVTYNNHSYGVRMNFVCELMGSYKEEIIGDTKREIAESTMFDLDAQGNIIESQYLGNFVQSSKESISEISRHTTENLIDTAEWNYFDGEYWGTDADYDTDCVGIGEESVGVLYSKGLSVNAGTYTFSAFILSTDTIKIYAGTPLVDVDDHYKLDLEVVRTEEAYPNSNYKRAYVTFTLNAQMNLLICVGSTVDETTNLYRPMFENSPFMSGFVAKGDPTSFTSLVRQTADAITQVVNGKASTSYVTQTANNIKQAIVDALGETGINISGTDRLIELIASKVVFSYYDNGVKKSDKVSINSSTGELSAVGGTFTRINVEDAKITGSLMFHKVLTSSKSSTEQGMTLFTGSGEGAVLLCDTFIIVGQRRSSGYSVFLPPARYFKGVKVKIINATTSVGSNGLEMDLSPITLEVLNGTTPKYITDIDENVRNTIVAGVPFKYFNGTQDSLLVGAPFSGYVTTNGGLLASGSTLYKSIELVATNNPFAGDGTDCAWMIINAEEE